MVLNGVMYVNLATAVRDQCGCSLEEDLDGPVPGDMECRPLSIDRYIQACLCKNQNNY